MIPNILSTYPRYLIKRSFLISAFVWIVMVCLDFSVTLVMELETISDERNFLSIFNMVLLEQPHKGLQYLESSMLIGTLITLTILNQQGNLVFLRSAGISPMRIVLLSGIGPLILSLLLILFDETLFLDLSQESKKFNQHYQMLTTEPFQWEIVDDNLIGLQRINDTDAQSIQIIEFNDRQKIISSSNYQKGKLNNGQLLITGLSDQNAFDFPTSFLFSIKTIENLPLTSLIGFKQKHQSKEDLQKINSLIYAKVLLPISIIAIIFIAGSLMFASLRSGGVGRQIIIGISLGLIYDLLKDLSVASFLTYQWPILIAHILPIMILVAIGIYKFQKI
tara:strand:+ start:1131 stop:2135 length:1005 start_codon:yes stop_codon:yes gene_type:complete